MGYSFTISSVITIGIFANYYLLSLLSVTSVIDTATLAEDYFLSFLSLLHVSASTTTNLTGDYLFVLVS